MLRKPTALAIAVLAASALAGCGSSGATNHGTVKIAVTIDGSKIITNSARVDVPVGDKVELDVTATGSGEVHVHSTPAQPFYYKPGSQTFVTKPLTIPGIIEVEVEQLHKTIVQLAVQ